MMIILINIDEYICIMMIILQVEKRSPKRPWRVCLRRGEKKVFIKMLFFLKGNTHTYTYVFLYICENTRISVRPINNCQRVLVIHTSLILLNMVNHFQTSYFQKDLEPKPTPTYIKGADVLPPVLDMIW